MLLLAVQSVCFSLSASYAPEFARLKDPLSTRTIRVLLTLNCDSKFRSSIQNLNSSKLIEINASLSHSDKWIRIEPIATPGTGLIYSA